jgi:hypothetical protein
LYFALTAAAYALVLPAIASLHVRHLAVRQSGAVLGTITGVVVVTFGVGAAALPPLVPAALFALGMWWWTIGKLWLETDVLPRMLGWLTVALAAAAFAVFALYAATSAQLAVADIPLHWTLGAWLLAVAAALWRASRMGS